MELCEWEHRVQLLVDDIGLLHGLVLMEICGFLVAVYLASVLVSKY
jgi:tetrahydromethanopterin S-methyltransferase subunit F